MRRVERNSLSLLELHHKKKKNGPRAGLVRDHMRPEAGGRSSQTKTFTNAHKSQGWSRLG